MWDGDWVEVAFYLCYSPSSKPTVWDGDWVEVAFYLCYSPCSKPTVWDGDIRKLRKWLTKVYSFFVPSPLRGMETVGLAYMPTRMYRRSSKPTVWGGDLRGFTGGIRVGGK